MYRIWQLATLSPTPSSSFSTLDTAGKVFFLSDDAPEPNPQPNHPSSSPSSLHVQTKASPGASGSWWTVLESCWNLLVGSIDVLWSIRKLRVLFFKFTLRVDEKQNDDWNSCFFFTMHNSFTKKVCLWKKRSEKGREIFHRRSAEAAANGAGDSYTQSSKSGRILGDDGGSRGRRSIRTVQWNSDKWVAGNSGSYAVMDQICWNQYRTRLYCTIFDWWVNNMLNRINLLGSKVIHLSIRVLLCLQ